MLYNQEDDDWCLSYESNMPSLLFCPWEAVLSIFKSHAATYLTSLLRCKLIVITFVKALPLCPWLFCGENCARERHALWITILTLLIVQFILHLTYSFVLLNINFLLNILTYILTLFSFCWGLGGGRRQSVNLWHGF